MVRDMWKGGGKKEENERRKESEGRKIAKGGNKGRKSETKDGQDIYGKSVRKSNN